jgi:hypothetical protein
MQFNARLMGRKVLFVALAAVAAVALTGCDPDPTPPEVTDIGFDNDNGWNTYAWSMETFNDKVYIGTNRAGWCWELAVRDYYFTEVNPLPGYQPQYESVHKDLIPQLECTDEPYDLPLQAQLWEFDPVSGAQTLVYEAPLVSNPDAPGKQISRYLGFRGMVVHEGALYVATASPGEFVPGLLQQSPPTILRSTDGRTFTPVPGGLPTVTVPNHITNDIETHETKGYRSLVSVDGRLFATATAALIGQGPVIEIVNPESANPTWTQVTAEDYFVFQIAVWRDMLYLGVADTKLGYTVYRSASPQDLTTFIPLVPRGAGRGNFIAAPVSMFPFNGALYVGSNGYGASLESELIRINPDDSWELVVGAAREVNGVTIQPTSGQGDGFGNPYNAHFWRMAEYNGGLYLGTNDRSYFAAAVGDPNAVGEEGFDLYATCDGNNWFTVTGDAFASGGLNFGVRTMEPYLDKLIIGGANQVEGNKVWTYKTLDCAALQQAAQAQNSANPATRMLAPTPAIPPSDLAADRRRCSVELTWQPAGGLDTGATYVVSRAPISQSLVTTSPQESPLGLLGSLLDQLTDPTTTVTDVVGDYQQVGTTTDLGYLDETPDNGAYSYRVSIQTDEGPAHLASTVAVERSTGCF